MSTRNALWWIALFVWMGMSTYWHVCKIKELCEVSVPAAPAPMVRVEVKTNLLRIQDADSLDLVAKGNFGFGKSGAQAEMSMVRTELDSLAGYLMAHPGKGLTVVGYYTSIETNATSYQDLGIARAEEIKQYLVGKGVSVKEISTTSEQLDSLPFTSDSLRGGINFIFRDSVPKIE